MAIIPTSSSSFQPIPLIPTYSRACHETEGIPHPHPGVTQWSNSVDIASKSLPFWIHLPPVDAAVRSKHKLCEFTTERVNMELRKCTPRDAVDAAHRQHVEVGIARVIQEPRDVSLARGVDEERVVPKANNVVLATAVGVAKTTESQGAQASIGTNPMRRKTWNEFSVQIYHSMRALFSGFRDVRKADRCSLDVSNSLPPLSVSQQKRLWPVVYCSTGRTAGGFRCLGRLLRRHGA